MELEETLIELFQKRGAQSNKSCESGWMGPICVAGNGGNAGDVVGDAGGDAGDCW